MLCDAISYFAFACTQLSFTLLNANTTVTYGTVNDTHLLQLSDPRAAVDKHGVATNGAAATWRGAWSANSPQVRSATPCHVFNALHSSIQCATRLRKSHDRSFHFYCITLHCNITSQWNSPHVRRALKYDSRTDAAHARFWMDHADFAGAFDKLTALSLPDEGGRGVRQQLRGIFDVRPTAPRVTVGLCPCTRVCQF
jgi:hypothetical protein